MPPRILIVEDDSDNRESLRELLELHAFPCAAVSDGGTALEFLRSEYFELILLDWRMPRVSGEQLLKIREEDERIRRVPVLVVTAAPVTELQLKSFHQVALLRKPFEPEDLLRRVEAFRDPSSSSG